MTSEMDDTVRIKFHGTTRDVYRGTFEMQRGDVLDLSPSEANSLIRDFPQDFSRVLDDGDEDEMTVPDPIGFQWTPPSPEPVEDPVPKKRRGRPPKDKSSGKKATRKKSGRK